jgi:hypothetical protein
MAINGCATNEAAKLAEDEQKRITANLDNFDDLDFNVFTNQKWDELQRSHSRDITVHWPDGHSTQGIEKQIEDLKALFVWAPDTRIQEHPVKFGEGEWTGGAFPARGYEGPGRRLSKPRPDVHHRSGAGAPGDSGVSAGSLDARPRTSGEWRDLHRAPLRTYGISER